MTRAIIAAIVWRPQTLHHPSIWMRVMTERPFRPNPTRIIRPLFMTVICLFPGRHRPTASTAADVAAADRGRIRASVPERRRRGGGCVLQQRPGCANLAGVPPSSGSASAQSQSGFGESGQETEEEIFQGIRASECNRLQGEKTEGRRRRRGRN